MAASARILAGCIALALAAAPAAFAQDTTESRLRDALRQTAEKLHQAEADLAQQQLATAAAERERDALKQAPRAKADGAQVAVVQRRLASVSADLAQAQAEQQKWQAAQQQAAQDAQRKEGERAALEKLLAQVRLRSEQCAPNDEALYGTSREIAALYRDAKFESGVRHPHLWPLGFDRVKEENRVRALEDRLAEQHALAQRCRAEALVPPAAGATPAAAPVPAIAPPATPSAPDAGQRP